MARKYSYLFLFLFAFNFIISLTKQDIYLHNPRGSNNRLNERSATRTNDDRVFDSQNNERGGYNVGDATNQPFKTEDEQYQMKYFQSGQDGNSYLRIEWTDQHGCGSNDDSDPSKQNCDLILQYYCQSKSDYAADDLDRLRDGLNTNSQDYTKMSDDTEAGNSQRKTSNVNLDRVLQERWEMYDACNYRERNNGLFTADQKLAVNDKGYSSAVFTRQNPGGNRRGYECPEERDYYPYWHPSIWKDISILTSNVSLCDYYLKQTFNTNSKNICIEKYNTGVQKHWSRWNNQKDCESNNGKWLEVFNYLEKAPQFKDQGTCESSKLGGAMKWAVPYDSKNVEKKECLILLPAPVCEQASWTRSNHLGNSRDGEAPGFIWKLPYFPSNKLQKCVFRIRYNISTDDYDPFKTDSKYNQLNSPVKNNPQVEIGADAQPLQLAINTAQYGRVFQDRSHIFQLLPRPSSLPNKANIYNLNVRGKRGNIVQVYPGVEYDFIPNKLTISADDLLHVQWTGSNTHNNGQPQGDGEVGDDGQGQTGTDRNNLVQVSNLAENFPLPYEMSTLWKDIELVGILDNSTTLNDDSSKYFKQFTWVNSLDKAKDVALYFSSSSYYHCVKSSVCEKSYESLPLLDSDLNNAPASLPGALFKFTKANNVYCYISSRNNNFSNRSQKGTITIL